MPARIRKTPGRGPLALAIADHDGGARSPPNVVRQRLADLRATVVEPDLADVSKRLSNRHLVILP